MTTIYTAFVNVHNFAGVSLKDSEFQQFCELLYRIAGISMSSSKKSLVTSRLAKRLAHYKMLSYGEYFQLIISPHAKQELQIAIDLLTTNETHFFREPKHFDFLRHHILNSARFSKPPRIWSAACSTGEEPYSLAMLLDDILGYASWEIVASDLNLQVLEQARTGIYSIDKVLEIPPKYLSSCCLKGTGSQEGTLLIERRLRERIQFIQHNLIEQPPKLGQFDIILLRNVLIYFNQETKMKVVSRLLPLLRSGGYFLVGHSETLNGISDDVKLIQPAIYQKI